jgi:hypothetical protein
VVDGSDFSVDVKLNSSTINDSEPGDTDENDISPPKLFKLFGWLNEKFHGLDNLQLIA